MDIKISINTDTYKKFQASLILTGETEESAINTLLNNYADSVLENAITSKSTENELHNIDNTAIEQKKLFISWFKGLLRNGKTYNPITISGYASRLENACNDPTFACIPINNIFTITSLTEFLQTLNLIKSCAGYAEYDAKTHNGFTAALNKYEEFLRLQTNGNVILTLENQSHTYTKSSNIHHWSLEEDIVCCKRFIEYFVIKRSNMNAVSFLQKLSKELPQIPEGSLRMKVQNIKFLAKQLGIEESFPLSPLSQYSIQCKKAFAQAVKELSEGK